MRFNNVEQVCADSQADSVADEESLRTIALSDSGFRSPALPVQLPELTRRQAQVLDFIESSIATHGCPPSLREICERFNTTSTNGASDHLKALERKRRVFIDGSGTNAGRVFRGIRVLAYLTLGERDSFRLPAPNLPAHVWRPSASAKRTPGFYSGVSRCRICNTATFTVNCPCCRSEVA